jgi:hypothetical protein
MPTLSKRVITICALLLGHLGLGASEMAAQQVIDQEQPLGQYTFSQINNWGAQTFTTSAANISGAGFRLGNYGVPGVGPVGFAESQVTINLWDGNPFLIGSTRLAGGIVTISAPSYELVWADAFWSPVAAVSATTYWLTVGNGTSDFHTLWFVGDENRANGSAYANGGAFDRDPGPEVGEYLDRGYGDLEFRTYTATVPEPSTVALLASGLIGLGLTSSRRRRKSPGV